MRSRDRVLALSAGTRRGLTLTWVVLFILSLLMQTGALALPKDAFAVHNEGLFQVDGNAVTDSGVAGDDWDKVYNGTSSANNTSFITDKVNDQTDDTFKGSTGDDQLLSQWGWVSAKASQQKNDITHAYAASYTDSLNHTIAYFGLDKWAPNGDNYAGFWFFKGPVGKSGDGSTSSGDPFTGSHQVGDILVLADYTNGGGVASFSVYKWVGSGGDVAPAHTLQTVATGVPCTGAPSTDLACGATNGAAITSPWPYQSAGSGDPANVFQPSEFFEGGIDLTSLGLDTGCYTSFLAETRSSQQVTATLSDFALGNFSFCTTPTMNTQVKQNGQNTSKIHVGESVVDVATLTSTTSVPVSGTVKFFVCGPTSAAADCTTGGSPVPANGAASTISNGTATSAAFTPTQAGTYCFRAEYTPDAAVANKYLPTSHTNSGSECFKAIAPATALSLKSITGATTGTNATVHTGSPVTIVVTETNTGNDALSSVSVTGTGCTTWTPASVASLAAGASQDFTCTTSSLTSDLAWSASGHGTDSLGSTVPTGAGTPEYVSGNIHVIAPATLLTLKSISALKVHTGTPVTIVVTEANTGNDTLSNVSVTGTGCTSWSPASVASLAAGATQDFTCTTANLTSDLAWSASGHGTDSLGTAVPTGSGTPEYVSGSVTVIAPATQLSIKSITSSPIETGSSVTIVVTETNTGNDTLSNVFVSGTGCTVWSPASISSLAAGAAQDFTCTVANVTSDLSWSASGHGTDSLNTAVPTGAGTPEYVSGLVSVIHPATTLSIKTSPAAVVHAGDPITIVVTETNSGDATLTGVSVSGTNSCSSFTAAAQKNNAAGAFSGSLAAGESVDFSCSFSAPSSSFSWSASGHGTDQLGNPVPTGSGTPEYQHGDITVIHPATTLTVKTPPATKVHAGDPVTIVVTESNSGDATLTGVSVSGTNSCTTFTAAAQKNGGAGAFSGSLAAGESVDFSCTFSAPSSSFSWSASGHGTDQLGLAVPTGSGTPEYQHGDITVIHPATTLTLVSATPNPALVGSTVTIVVNEKNTGDDPLTAVTVSGSPCATWTAVDAGFNGTLAAGASEDFRCVVTNVGPANVAWSATGQGKDSLGVNVPLAGEHQEGTVHVVNPSIDLVKTAGSALDAQAADGTTYPTADGSTVVYRYEVTTQDPDGLTAVTVTDDRCATVTAVMSNGHNIGDTNADGVLQPGETWLFSCTMSVSIAANGTTIHNVATASGQPVVGGRVSTTDDALVAIAKIAIVKTAGTAVDGATYDTEAFTGNVVYHYLVTNTGGADLVNVVVVDDNGTPSNTADDFMPCGDQPLSLAPGASTTCNSTQTVTSDRTNIATVTGGTSLQPTVEVSASDDAKVHILGPAISIVKTAAGAPDGTVYVTKPGNVTYSYLVTNTGDLPLSNVVVKDDNGTPSDPTDDFTATCPATTLAVGASMTCTATIDVTASRTNIAVVSAVTDHGAKVSATDNAAVRVPDLVIAKGYVGNTGGTDPSQKLAKVGDTLTYTLTYTLSNGPVTGGVIVDTIPAGLTYVTASATNDSQFTFQSYDSTTRKLTWTAATVATNGSVTYKVTVDANAFSLTQPLVNVATIVSDQTNQHQATANVGVQRVEAATSPPSLPPTDAAPDQGGSNGQGSALGLALMILALIAFAAGRLVPAPRPSRAPIRRDDRRS